MSKTPDLIEPFIGWKGLLADSRGGLWSPAVETFWPVGKPLLAECATNKRHTSPPVASCTCGIYAVKTYEDLKEHRYHWGGPPMGLGSNPTDDTHKVWVLAEIALYGQVRKGQIGWRASKAAVQTVYVPAHKLALGKKIRDRYGVSLGMIDRFRGDRMLLGRR